MPRWRTSAVGNSSSAASTMPSPARRIGARPTRWASVLTSATSRGVSIRSVQRVRSAVASYSRRRVSSRMSWRNSQGGVSRRRRRPSLWRISGCWEMCTDTPPSGCSTSRVPRDALIPRDANEENRLGKLREETRGHATGECAVQPGPAVGRQDDEIDLVEIRDLGELLGRTPAGDAGMDLPPFLTQGVGLCFQVPCRVVLDKVEQGGCRRRSEGRAHDEIPAGGSDCWNDRGEHQAGTGRTGNRLRIVQRDLCVPASIERNQDGPARVRLELPTGRRTDNDRRDLAAPHYLLSDTSKKQVA